MGLHQRGCGSPRGSVQGMADEVRGRRHRSVDQEAGDQHVQDVPPPLPVHRGRQQKVEDHRDVRSRHQPDRVPQRRGDVDGNVLLAGIRIHRQCTGPTAERRRRRIHPNQRTIHLFCQEVRRLGTQQRRLEVQIGDFVERRQRS